MRLCTARRSGNEFIGLGIEDGWLDLTAFMKDHADQFPWMALRPAPTIVDLQANTPDLGDMLATICAQLEDRRELDRYRVEGEMKLLAPVVRPGQIIAMGRNYAAHAEESGFPPPEEPIIFAKSTSSVIGPGEKIVYPPGVSRLDPEIELAVVIGRCAKDVRPDEAMQYVAGYTIFNDVSARDIQIRDLEQTNPWFRSKAYDTFGPTGPYLVLKDEIPDPHNLELTLRVNGEIRQQSSTANCIFKIAGILAFITHYLTLYPGDIVATGTPEGIAPIERGDIMECTISGLGTLSNPVG